IKINKLREGIIRFTLIPILFIFLLCMSTECFFKPSVIAFLLFLLFLWSWNISNYKSFCNFCSTNYLNCEQTFRTINCSTCQKHYTISQCPASNLGVIINKEYKEYQNASYN